MPADVLTQWRAAGQRSKACARGLGQAARSASADKRAEFERRMRGDLPADKLDAAVRAVKESARRNAEGDRDPHRLASSRWRRIIRGGAGNDRRLGRPHRLQQHPHQGDEGDVGDRLRRPLHPLRHARARHGRRHERHGAAWRHHSLFRHVPGVLRLLPAGDPACRADGRARHPCDDARLRSASARMARRTSRSSIWPRCARSRISSCSVPAMRSRRWNAGSSRCEAQDRPSVLALTRQNLPQLRTRRSTSATAAPPAPTRSSPAAGQGAGARSSPPARKSRSRSRRRSCSPNGACRRALSRCRASSCSSKRPTAARRAVDRRRAGQGRRRGRRPPGLGRDHRLRRRLRRHGRVRRQRALQGPLQAFRHHAARRSPKRR